MYNVVGRLALDFQLEIGVGGGGGEMGVRETDRERQRQRQAGTDRQTDRDTERVQTNTQRPKASVKESYRQITATFKQLFFSYNNEERLLWENEKECGDRGEE